MTPIKECLINNKTDLIPIWLMIQAGRYLPEFREIRKKNQNFINLCLNSKLSKEITVAAKMCDPDPEKNPRLRLAVKEAKQNSVPKDVIERAIKKSTAGDGDDYEEIRYEGYGPNGIAVIVEAMTDNKNRTASNVRAIFSKNGGNLGETGSVGFMFERKGEIMFQILRERADEGWQISGDGVLEVLQDGFGFLRSPDANYLPGPDDIYVSPSQIKQNSLRTGDTVEGEMRAPRESERYFAITKIDKINFEEVFRKLKTINKFSLLIILLFCGINFYFFNFPYSIWGGGFFHKLSNVIFDNNYLFFIFSFFSILIIYLILEKRFSNYLLLILFLLMN